MATPTAVDPPAAVQRSTRSAVSSWSRTTSGFGMVVFLASDLMLFAAFFSAYFVLRGASTSPWPPADVELDVLRAAVATAALVASSATLWAADRALERDDGAASRRWVLATLGLGVAFLANQLLEYRGLAFGVDAHTYGSVFWLLTGLHALHVAAGLGALAMLFVRLARARDRSRVAPFATSVSAYWHLVDVVWVGVFATIWVLR